MSFQPRCLRCENYDLPCKIGNSTWTARAQRHWMSTIPSADSRALHWGSTSIAGGHPAELHGVHVPPEPRIRSYARPPSPTNRHSTCISGRIHLDVDERVRSHLYQIYFDHIDPIWPVVCKADITQHRPPPLLDCAILGTAARHHLAIVSWRDWVHVQRVLACELRWLFNIRKPYQPDIATLQGLLILCLRLELSCQSHIDMMSVPMRLSLMCQMAQELEIYNYNDPNLLPAEALLRRDIWYACIFQDAYVSAMFGQSTSIVLHDSQTIRADIEAAYSTLDCYHFFLHAVLQALDLRSVLNGSEGYFCGGLETKETPYDQPIENISARPQDKGLSEHESKLIDILRRNNQLLCLLQKVSSNTVSCWESSKNEVAWAKMVVDDSCEVLAWCTQDFQQSNPAQLCVWLYCATRALMLIVNVSICRKQDNIAPSTLDTRIEDSIRSARLLKDRLLEDVTWGLHWIQGHTISAVLRLLDNETKAPAVSPAIAKIAGMCDLHTPDAPIVEVAKHQPQADPGSIGLLDEVFLCPMDWTDIFRQYDFEHNPLLVELP